MKYYLYILKSLSVEKYYIGISQNPERRLYYHNNFEKGFTASYRPWEIVLIKEFVDKESALVAERKVKNWKSRKMIERLINGEINL